MNCPLVVLRHPPHRARPGRRATGPGLRRCPRPECRPPAPGRHRHRAGAPAHPAPAGRRPLPEAIRGDLREWWLAEGGDRSRTPTWDIASTCTVSGRKGLFLVEAKAHSKEISKSDRSGAKPANRKRIESALEEANAGLRELTGGSWRLSAEHHYQLSNRFAWSWKLTRLGVPVVLPYLGFLNAVEMADKGRLFGSGEDWRDTLLDHCSGAIDAACWESMLDDRPANEHDCTVLHAARPPVPSLGIGDRPLAPSSLYLIKGRRAAAASRTAVGGAAPPSAGSGKAPVPRGFPACGAWQRARRVTCARGDDPSAGRMCCCRTKRYFASVPGLQRTATCSSRYRAASSATADPDGRGGIGAETGSSPALTRARRGATCPSYPLAGRRGRPRPVSAHRGPK